MIYNTRADEVQRTSTTSMADENKDNIESKEIPVVPAAAPASEPKTEIIKDEEESTAPQTDNIINAEEKSGFKLPNFKLPKLSEIPDKLRHWFSEYKRVIIVSRKPDIEELSKISKISGIGILVIGLLGFVIQLIFQLIKGV